MKTLALVLGGAACVWHDVHALEEILGREFDGLIVAANDIGCHWPRQLDHWVSLHTEKLPRWREERLRAGHPGRPCTWGRTRRSGVDQVLRPWAGGSSGQFAVCVAMHLGAERIVLCGVPMTKDPHFAESKVHQPNKKWQSADAHFRAWRRPENLRKLRGVVRSMSGRTQQLLGAPTRSWLAGGESFPWQELEAA